MLRLICPLEGLKLGATSFVYLSILESISLCGNYLFVDVFLTLTQVFIEKIIECLLLLSRFSHVQLCATP